MAAMSAVDRENRKRAFEQLSQALEEITVKSVVDFRNLASPGPELEQVALAVCGTVAALDDPNEATAAPPASSWPEAQATMSKPGHFINSLRRFPYAVDSGRVPAKNISVAKAYLEGPKVPDEVTLQALHPVGLSLHKWLSSALGYALLRPEQAAPAQPAALAAKSAQGPASLGGPKQQEYGGGPRKLEAKPVNGRPAQGRTTRPPAATAQTEATATRVKSQTGAGGSRAQGGGYGGYSNIRSVAPAPKVTSPAAVARGRQMADTQANSEDWQRMLETTKREVREIRALESQVKWKMLRDEKNQLSSDKDNADKELTEWRWNEQDTMRAYLEQREQRLKLTELAESKDFQEFKRLRKAGEREQEKKWIEEQYREDTESAAWEMELAKAIQEEKKLAVQDHFEQYDHLKNYAATLRIVEQQEQDETRAVERATEMDYRQRELVKQKEALLQSLEFARSCQGQPISTAGRTSARQI